MTGLKKRNSYYYSHNNNRSHTNRILGAVLEPVADSRIVKAVLVLSGSLENMIYMIAVTVVLMCLTMAIICFATNINLYV